MKKVRIYFVVLLCLLTAQFSFAQSDIQKQLSEISQIAKIEKLESTAFAEKYLAYFTQKIDPKNDSVGTFQQYLTK